MLGRVCIPGGFWGERHVLLADLDAGTFRWVDDMPNDCWVLGVGPSGRNLLEVARLSNMKIRSAPEGGFRAAFDALGVKDVTWRLSVPGRAFRAFIASLVDDIRNVIIHGCVSYYDDVFRRAGVCLERLGQACIDGRRLSTYIANEKNETNRSALSSFEPSDGYAARVAYDRLGTVTGRLTVSSGPRIITLPKRYRDIIVSRHERGRIVSLDFSSLEPRIILDAQGLPAGDDIYGDICREMPHLDVARAKPLTIALLYGAGEQTLGRISGLRGSTLFETVERLTTTFGISTLHQRLSTELGRDGKILNGYGRPVYVKEDQQRKLVNYFSQSTAVDRALLGFSAAVELSSTMGWGITPLFVIHDDLIVDVHPDALDHIDEFKEACSVLPGSSKRFPLKYREIR